MDTLYLSINFTSPASLFGGTWEKLPEGYALWTATSGAGETIAAGLPNITGRLALGGTENGSYHAQGALYSDGGSSSGKPGHYTGSGTMPYIQLDASRQMDGNNPNGIYGNSTTVQPPAYKIYAWKRIS